MIHLFYFGYACSGAATYTQELCTGLSDYEDIRLYQVCLNDCVHQEFTVETKEHRVCFYIPVVEYKTLVTYAARCLNLLAPWIDDKDNLIFHLNDATQVKIGELAKERWTVRVVFTWHFVPPYFVGWDVDNSTVRTPFQENVLDREMIQMADKIICVTNYAQRIVIGYYRQLPEKTVLIFNGYGDIKGLLKRRQENRNELRKKYGFRKQDLILLFVGRIYPEKGIDVLIDTFVPLWKEQRNIRLVIIGSGEIEHCLNRITEGYGGITFTGSLEYQVVNDFYRFADIGVIPSLYEQCSYVALEMMANGLPIVYTDIPGLGELFVNGKNGKMVNTQFCNGNVNVLSCSLKSVLLELLFDRAYRRNLGQEGCKKWKKEYQAVHMIAKVLNVYKEMNGLSGDGNTF